MIVQRIQLFCDGQGCGKYFPDEGPVNGQLINASELRQAASEFGWTKRRKTNGGFSHTDLCPKCSEKGPAAA